jgi:ABC-type dipeptide/oligopeptide/nickel transport system permease component
MGRYILKRVVVTIPVLLGVLLLVFSMLHLLPGDPVLLMMTDSGTGAVGGNLTNQEYQQIRHQLGLDRPLYQQFGLYVYHAVRGNLGESFRSQQPVAHMIAQSLPATGRLALLSLGLGAVLGILLGTVAGVWHNSWVDNASMLLALLGVAMPGFWLGLMLLFLFSLYLGWLPATGYGSWNAILLPAATLALRTAAVIARLTRSSLLEVLNNEYVMTARSKGLQQRVVIARHALHNALLPVVTVVGLQFGDLLAGTVVIETVFARPGIGSLAVNAILAKDYPVVQGTVLLVAVFYVFANLLTDVSYAFIDPRIQYR